MKTSLNGLGKNTFTIVFCSLTTYTRALYSRDNNRVLFMINVFRPEHLNWLSLSTQEKISNIGIFLRSTH